jgi:hypothetical protein
LDKFLITLKSGNRKVGPMMMTTSAGISASRRMSKKDKMSAKKSVRRIVHRANESP